MSITKTKHLNSCGCVFMYLFTYSSSVMMVLETTPSTYIHIHTCGQNNVLNPPTSMFVVVILQGEKLRTQRKPTWTPHRT